MHRDVKLRQAAALQRNEAKNLTYRGLFGCLAALREIILTTKHTKYTKSLGAGVLGRMIWGQNDEPLLRRYFHTGNYLRCASDRECFGEPQINENGHTF